MNINESNTWSAKSGWLILDSNKSQRVINGCTKLRSRLMARRNNLNSEALPFSASSPDQALQRWCSARGGRRITLVTVGQSGAGKSTLVKNLLRLKDERAPAVVHSPSAVTSRVNIYESSIEGAPIRIVDTPGLVTPDHNDDHTIAELRKETNGEADMLLYCTSMAPCSKLGIIDMQIIKLLTSTFTEQIWQRTILVLTFADIAVKMRNDSDRQMHQTIEEIVQSYAKEFENVLERGGIKSKIPDLSVPLWNVEDLTSERPPPHIPAIPTGYNFDEMILPHTNSFDCVYLEVLKKCNKVTTPVLFRKPDKNTCTIC